MHRPALALLILLVPSLAAAHVTVRPRESKAGAEERYTVRVPTEGTVATTQVVVEIPEDVTVLETLLLVKGADGAWKIRHSHTSSRPRRPPA